GGVATAPAAAPVGQDRPLFEADDLDAILGVKQPSTAYDLDDTPARRPVSGPDAASLPDHDVLVLSTRTAVVLGVVMLVLLIGAFLLGVQVGGRW
ncbi:MAG: hypothetical protein K2X82_14400, partial [Gemmataceae bacterium]|nr:hypothetical protein [Gemmataceae bacterium]